MVDDNTVGISWSNRAFLTAKTRRKVNCNRIKVNRNRRWLYEHDFGTVEFTRQLHFSNCSKIFTCVTHINLPSQYYSLSKKLDSPSFCLNLTTSYVNNRSLPFVVLRWNRKIWTSHVLRGTCLPSFNERNFDNSLNFLQQTFQLWLRRFLHQNALT